MLKGLDPLLTPDLLYLLAQMGHGDEILIADANFPAVSLSQRLCRLDGVGVPRAIRAILSVMPLDQYVKAPAIVMSVVDDPATIPDTESEFQALLGEIQGEDVCFERLERYAFYERARGVFAVVATSEARLYGNIILKRGVIEPTGAADA